MAAPLVLSSNFTNSERAMSTTVINNSYILNIVPLQSHYAIATSAGATDAIHLLDKTSGKTITKTLDVGDVKISEIRTVGNLANNRDVLLSCGNNGSVKAWDERTGAVSIEMPVGKKKIPLLSCDASSDGLMVAAGTVLQGQDASIVYWDPRNPVAPLRKHNETHSDDVTSVRFSRMGSEEILLSASTDGLLCTSNPTEDDEDEAGLNVGNWGCSIAKAGWIAGEGSVRAWARSDMETVSLWSGELDSVRDLSRDYLAHPHAPYTWVSDYMVDCHSTSRNPFVFFAGSSEGDVALIAPSPPLSADSQWTIERAFSKGHTEVVRCALWDESNGILLTGAEDSKINIWSCSVSLDPNAMDVDSSAQKRIPTEDIESTAKRIRSSEG